MVSSRRTEGPVGTCCPCTVARVSIEARNYNDSGRGHGGNGLKEQDRSVFTMPPSAVEDPDAVPINSETLGMQGRDPVRGAQIMERTDPAVSALSAVSSLLLFEHWRERAGPDTRSARAG